LEFSLLISLSALPIPVSFGRFGYFWQSWQLFSGKTCFSVSELPISVSFGNSCHFWQI